jgi:hypothetical protein
MPIKANGTAVKVGYVTRRPPVRPYGRTGKYCDNLSRSAGSKLPQLTVLGAVFN